MTPEQLEGFRAGLGIREGREWEPFEAMSLPQKGIEALLRKVTFNAEGRRHFEETRVDVRTALPVPSGDVRSEAGGGGKACGTTCGSVWSRRYKKKIKHIKK